MLRPDVFLAAMHGLRAEGGVFPRAVGAQSDPAWRHFPEGGAGGEQEELPEKSNSTGGAGRVTKGQTQS